MLVLPATKVALSVPTVTWYSPGFRSLPLMIDGCDSVTL